MQQIETSEQSQQNFKDIQAEVKPLKSKFRLENLEGPERHLVIEIDEHMRSYKPKKIISQQVCINQQFPFWVDQDKINPEIEKKAHEFITVGQIKNHLRIKFLKKGEPLIADKSIIRKVAPIHRITPIPSQDHNMLSALRACRMKHYLMWQNDISIIKQQAQKEKEKFDTFFGKSTIEDNFGNETQDLQIYAQVFNCKIFIHQDIFPDPKALKFDVLWKTDNLSNNNQTTTERQPWICNILKIDHHIFAVRVKDLQEAKNIDYSIQKKIYYVPLVYKNVGLDWFEQYKMYNIQISAAIEFFDKEKIITTQTALALKELEPIVYFKRQERKKLNTQQKQMDLGKEQQATSITDQKQQSRYLNNKILYYEEKYLNQQIQAKQQEQQQILLELKDLEQQLEIQQKQMSKSS